MLPSYAIQSGMIIEAIVMPEAAQVSTVIDLIQALDAFTCEEDKKRSRKYNAPCEHSGVIGSMPAGHECEIRHPPQTHRRRVPVSTSGGQTATARGPSPLLDHATQVQNSRHWRIYASGTEAEFCRLVHRLGDNGSSLVETRSIDRASKWFEVG